MPGVRPMPNLRMVAEPRTTAGDPHPGRLCETPRPRSHAARFDHAEIWQTCLQAGFAPVSDHVQRFSPPGFGRRPRLGYVMHVREGAPHLAGHIGVESDLITRVSPRRPGFWVPPQPGLAVIERSSHADVGVSDVVPMWFMGVDVVVPRRGDDQAVAVPRGSGQRFAPLRGGCRATPQLPSPVQNAGPNSSRPASG